MTVLVIAPHADDEVLGPGGTIARWVREGRDVVVAVLTGHGDEPHPLWPREQWDVIRSECTAAAQVLGVRDVLFRELPAACLDTTPNWQLTATLNELLDEVRPEEVLAPFTYDLHRDHAAVAYGVSVVTRPYLARGRGIRRVLAYETLSETHLAAPYMTPSFQPNLFVDISETLELKIEAMEAYASQLQDDGLPRSIGSLRALATMRGAHIGVPAAEAFVTVGEYVR